MSGVQRFIHQRHQEQPASPRQVLGDQLRVAVAPTRLARNNSKPPTSKTTPDTAAVAPPQRQNFEPPGSSDVEHGHDAFDTDVEGLDDTTITSIGDDSRSHQSSMQGTSLLPSGLTEVQNHGFNPVHGLHGNGYKQRPIGQRMGQLEAEAATIENDSESYEESGDEEDDENGEGSEEEYEVEYVEQQHFPNADEAIMQEIGLEFSQYRQTETAASKQAMFQQLAASPSMRNMSFRTAPKSSHRTVKPFTSPSHRTGGNLTSSDVDQNRSTQHSNSVNKGETPVLLKASKEMISGPHQQDQSVSPTGGEQPLPMPQVQTLQGRLGDDLGIANGRPMVHTNSSGRKMSPSAAHKKKVVVNGHAEFDHISPSNDGPWTATLIPNDARDISLSSQKNEDIDELNDHQSIASIGDPKCLKRSRDIDYSLDELSSMAFSQLQDEPFHHDPKATELPLPPDIADAPLPQKLDYILSLKDDNSNKEHHRAAFFSSLPIEQYEDCGDLIVQKFADVVSKFKDARQQRRKVARDFEDEVAKREERVRGKMGAVEKDLGRLKRGGEEVVRGKLGMS